LLELEFPLDRRAIKDQTVWPRQKEERADKVHKPVHEERTLGALHQSHHFGFETLQLMLLPASEKLIPLSVFLLEVLPLVLESFFRVRISKQQFLVEVNSHHRMIHNFVTQTRGAVFPRIIFEVLVLFFGDHFFFISFRRLSGLLVSIRISIGFIDDTSSCLIMITLESVSGLPGLPTSRRNLLRSGM